MCKFSVIYSALKPNFTEK